MLENLSYTIVLAENNEDKWQLKSNLFFVAFSGISSPDNSDTNSSIDDAPKTPPRSDGILLWLN